MRRGIEAKEMKYLLGLKTLLVDEKWLCERISVSSDLRKDRSSGKCVKRFPERSSSFRRPPEQPIPKWPR